MRIKRLIQKKTKKFIIKNLANNLSTLFQAYNMSDMKFCKIPNVELKFFKNTTLANRTDSIKVKIDGQVLPKILETGEVDNFIFNFLKRHLKKKSIFIDVGSNLGLVSLQVSKIKHIKKIITFEPVDEIYELSTYNLKKIKNIEQYNFGWSKKDSREFFYENPTNSGDYSLISSKQRNIKHIFNFRNANKELNKIILKRNNLELILKTDCQGYDIEIFNLINENILKKISIYFLECKQINNNQKKIFFKKLTNFDKIYVSCPLIHAKTKLIRIENLEEYFNYKVEFDLILIK